MKESGWQDLERAVLDKLDPCFRDQESGKWKITGTLEGNVVVRYTDKLTYGSHVPCLTKILNAMRVKRYLDRIERLSNHSVNLVRIEALECQMAAAECCIKFAVDFLKTGETKAPLRLDANEYKQLCQTLLTTRELLVSYRKDVRRLFDKIVDLIHLPWQFNERFYDYYLMNLNTTPNKYNSDEENWTDAQHLVRSIWTLCTHFE